MLMAPKNIPSIVAIVLVSCLFVCIGIWWSYFNSKPAMEFHTIVMPNPNAFDNYLKATKLLVDKKNIDNALKMMTQLKKDSSNGVSPKNLTLIERVVDSNHSALSELRKGFPYEYMGPQSTSINQLYPYYSGFRKLAQLLSMNAYLKTCKAEYGVAMDESLNAMELGSDLPNDRIVIALLVGIACQKTSRRIAWDAIDNLNARETEESLRRVQRMGANSIPLAQTLEQEKEITLRTMLMAMNTKQGAEPFQSLYGLQNWEKRRVLYKVSGHYDERIECVKKPYSNNTPILISDRPRLLRNPFTWRADNVAAVISMVVLPVYEELVLLYTGNDTFNTLFEASLALHAYKLQNGKYPDKLDQLSKYCKMPIHDPFAAKDSLRYKRTTNGYLLYSVGPDGVDNGGQPIMNTNQNPKSLKIEATSKGDIVVGLMKM